MERGRLRVYLGAAPGVGKTYAMLDEGRRRSERGTDVVVGLVETHGRAKTAAAIGGLDVVPRRREVYRGLSTEDMDLEAVLARRPDVALVDELAHTNVPGGPHAKRWQDVHDLLDAGIDVITTVNIQHLESLNDVVEGITGVRQRETVPDTVVRTADAVELVDMSPQALRRRLAHGNVYPADRVDTALTHYFREGNLAALRELALLWLADRVDEGLERYRGSHGIDATWATRERVLAGVSGGGESEALMRRAARIASRTTGGEWQAVLVTTRDGLSSTGAHRLEQLRDEAAGMGGSFHVTVAHDPAAGLLDFARGINATQVIIGASRRSRWSTLLRPGVGELTIAQSGDIDVHIVSHDLDRTRRRRSRRTSGVSVHRLIAGYALALLGTGLLALLLSLTRDVHSLLVESLLMLSMVVLTALVGGLLPAVVAAVLGGLLLNYLFVEPVGTLTISDPENALAIVVFLLVGVAVSSVVDQAGRRSAEARRARAEANSLAVLAHSLMHTGEGEPGLLANACEVFGMVGAAVVRTVDGNPEVVAEHGEAPHSRVEADAAADIDDDTALLLRGRVLDARDRALLTAFAGHARVLRERRQAQQERIESANLAEGNRTRTALLAAVSHDLRSPLAAIKAAASSLRSTDVDWSVDDEAELLATIEESADRLDNLVGNLLDMSRLQTGRITPLLAELDLAELVSRAVRPLGGQDRVRFVELDELPAALADPGLLERVVANVAENAIKHTPSTSPIEIRGCTFTEQERPRVSVRVVDHGVGIPEESREDSFAPFQRLGDVPNGEGLGLGLAVARGLAEAMDGAVTAEETPGGGLTMVIDLPAVAEAGAGTPGEPTSELEKVES